MPLSMPLAGVYPHAQYRSRHQGRQNNSVADFHFWSLDRVVTTPKLPLYHNKWLQKSTGYREHSPTGRATGNVPRTGRIRIVASVAAGPCLPVPRSEPSAKKGGCRWLVLQPQCVTRSGIGGEHTTSPALFHLASRLVVRAGTNHLLRKTNCIAARDCDGRRPRSTPRRKRATRRTGSWPASRIPTASSPSDPVPTSRPPGRRRSPTVRR